MPSVSEKKFNDHFVTVCLYLGVALWFKVTSHLQRPIKPFLLLFVKINVCHFIKCFQKEFKIKSREII